MIATLTRQFRDALEVSVTGSWSEVRKARDELADLTDQILDARILDGVDDVADLSS